MQRRFVQVDVFGEQAYRGNPLAVVLDAEGLSDDQMQRFANWTNLSETTFVLTPTDVGADYRVRIFTPSEELPFAAIRRSAPLTRLRSGGTARRADHVVQQCGAGLIQIRQNGDALSFAAPPMIRSGEAEQPLIDELAATLGIARTSIRLAQWVDNGPGWVAVLLDTAAEVLAVRPRPTEHKIGLVGPHPPGSPEAFEVRAFFPSDGVTREDPVTGSLQASLAQWMIGSGLITAPYVTRQGTVLGRIGRVQISTDDVGSVWVGGQTVTCITGEVDL